MLSFKASLLLVAAIVLLASGSARGELEFLEECEDRCPFYPGAQCQVMCAYIAGTEGHDCVETFVYNGELVNCNL